MVIRRATMSLATWLLAFMSQLGGATPAAIEPPLTAQKIMEFVSQQGVRSIDALLPSLPESHKKNVVFVHDSRSLQMATHEAPRQIMFGYDGRFLMAIGSVPDDPGSDFVEFAEFNDQTGFYEYGEISFAGAEPHLTRNPKSCEACHGAPARPIWGSYPDWPGVYSSDSGWLKGDEWNHFKAFYDAAQTSPRYAHLDIEVLPQGETSGVFWLKDRRYQFPNTVFSFVLGNTVTLGAETRLKRHPRYDELRWLVLATSSAVGCERSAVGSELNARVKELYEQELKQNTAFAARFGEASRYSAAVMVYRLLGIDPPTELQLGTIIGERPPWPFWYAGHLHVDEAMAWLILDEALRDDEVLAQAFASVKDDLAAMNARFRLVGEERGRALAESDEYPSWYRQNRRIVQVVGEPYATERNETRDRVCRRLLERGSAH